MGDKYHLKGQLISDSLYNYSLIRKNPRMHVKVYMWYKRSAQTKFRIFGGVERGQQTIECGDIPTHKFTGKNMIVIVWEEKTGTLSVGSEGKPNE